jgi:hypothetical protein
MRLRPAGSAVGAGIAVVAARGVRREVLVQARLASGGGRYELRLSGGGGESRSLGVLRADARGNLRAALPLPADYRSFATLDLTGVDGPAVLSAQLGAA